MDALFLVYLLASAAAEGGNQKTVVPANVSLSHFAQIDDRVYVGSKPRTDQDFQFLQSLHIRYIVSARFLPFLSGPEKRHAKRYGMTLLSFPMNASPIPPSEKHVDQILRTLRNSQFLPVYVHCVLGRDRTSLIAGLYKMYFLGVPKPVAWQEMKRSGFHTWWFVRGLRTYFENHSTPPSSMHRKVSVSAALAVQATLLPRGGKSLQPARRDIRKGFAPVSVGGVAAK